MHTIADIVLFVLLLAMSLVVVCAGWAKALSNVKREMNQ